MSGNCPWKRDSYQNVNAVPHSPWRVYHLICHNAHVAWHTSQRRRTFRIASFISCVAKRKFSPRLQTSLNNLPHVPQHAYCFKQYVKLACIETSTDSVVIQFVIPCDAVRTFLSLYRDFVVQSICRVVCDTFHIAWHVSESSGLTGSLLCHMCECVNARVVLLASERRRTVSLSCHVKKCTYSSHCIRALS